MFVALSAAMALAAGAPKVIYKAEPSAPSDVGTVALTPAVDLNCFEAVLAQVLSSSRKSDRTQSYFLSVTLAASNGAPSQITGAQWGEGKPLKLVNLRIGDVACHDYVCPTGSTGIFALDDEVKAAALAGGLKVQVASTIGGSCTLNLPVAAAPFTALDEWSARLPKPK